MAWNLEEALAHYQTLGAPGDQNALTSLLREIRQENGGSIPGWVLPKITAAYGIKESYLTALLRRYPSLRLADTHCLELCGGRSCAGSRGLASYAQQLHSKYPQRFSLKFTGCMHFCGKGPNIKWDGQLYHKADEALIRQLVESVPSKTK